MHFRVLVWLLGQISDIARNNSHSETDTTPFFWDNLAIHWEIDKCLWAPSIQYTNGLFLWVMWLHSGVSQTRKADNMTMKCFVDWSWWWWYWYDRRDATDHSSSSNWDVCQFMRCMPTHEMHANDISNIKGPSSTTYHRVRIPWFKFFTVCMRNNKCGIQIKLRSTIHQVWLVS